jgi:hypothetical protein
MRINGWRLRNGLRMEADMDRIARSRLATRSHLLQQRIEALTEG